MPDLVVEGKDELWLTEVKFRTNKEFLSKGRAVRFKNWEILKCKQYWSEALLVLLAPYGERFYAQRMVDLEVDPQNTNADTWFTFDAFRKLPDFFPPTAGTLSLSGWPSTILPGCGRQRPKRSHWQLFLDRPIGLGKRGRTKEPARQRNPPVPPL